MNDQARAALPPCRVLLLMPNWLGDVVMATGLLQLLHQNRTLPDGRRLELTVGVRRQWAPLFRADPRCDRLLELDKPGRHGGPRGVWALARDVARSGFSAAVLGPPSLRVGLAAALARVPVRVGYRGDGRRLLLTDGLPTPVRGSVHYFQEMLVLGERLLERLNAGAGPGDRPRATSLEGCRDLPAATPAGGAPRWVLAPGATFGQAKTWPLARAAEFARLALEEGVELVLLGDAAAAGFAAQLADSLPGPSRSALTGQPGLVNLTGGTTLPEVVGLLKSAQAFVGNDSGLMHLAAALNVPTLGLFGSSNPDWTAPVGDRTLALAAEGFPCRPCYRRTCNHSTFCLDTLSGEVVLASLHGLLAGGRPGPKGAS